MHAQWDTLCEFSAIEQGEIFRALTFVTKTGIPVRILETQRKNGEEFGVWRKVVSQVALERMDPCLNMGLKTSQRGFISWLPALWRFGIK